MHIRIIMSLFITLMQLFNKHNSIISLFTLIMHRYDLLLSLANKVTCIIFSSLLTPIYYFFLLLTRFTMFVTIFWMRIQT